MSTSGLSRVEDGARPRVFVCPGIYGDDKRLAQFRRFCEPFLDLHLLPLPAPEAPAKLLGSLPQTGAVVADTIRDLQPTGLVRLVGYSFGGNVAFEAARFLAGAGRAVSLALIDAYISHPEADPAARRRSLARRLIWVGFDLACRQDGVRRLLLAMVRRLWPKQRTAYDRRALWSLRRRATASWRPRPVALPILLIMSEPFAAGLRLWHAFAPNAVVVRCPVDHWAILLPPAAGMARDALVAHLTNIPVSEPTSPS